MRKEDYEYCRGCVHLMRPEAWGDWAMCVYFESGHLRPCKAGVGCTVRDTRTSRATRARVSWDTAKAFQLWKSGSTDTEIAQAIGVAKSTVAAYRKKMWGPANSNGNRKGYTTVKWDIQKGYELYRQGLTDREISEKMGITKGSLTGYRARHWGKPNLKKRGEDE